MLKTFYHQPKPDQGLLSNISLSLSLCLPRGAGAEQQPEKFGSGFYLWGLNPGVANSSFPFLPEPLGNVTRTAWAADPAQSWVRHSVLWEKLGAGLNMDLSSAGRGEWELLCHWIGCSKAHPHLCESRVSSRREKHWPLAHEKWPGFSIYTKWFICIKKSWFKNKCLDKAASDFF